MSVTIVYSYSFYLDQAIPFRSDSGYVIGVMFADGKTRTSNVAYRVRYAYYES